jgi:3'-phosphoadenosine 5'-phosphosulfate (PAPS) 3'-phosphatase
MNAGQRQRELEAAVTAALTAGEIVQDYYERAAAATYEKGDGSPVTDADLAADRAIHAVLLRYTPEIPILSEEHADDAARLFDTRCWLVDPVDGTEQFIKRTGEFDVLIALVEDGRPVVAVGYQPPTRVLIAATRGGGAWLQRADAQPVPIHFEPPSGAIRLATSKWFGAPENREIVGAIAARLGLDAQAPTVTGFSPRLFLAPRAIDVMLGIRPGADQTMASEWDFAVADLVFHEAGGVVSDLEGLEHRYNKPEPRNTGGLIAAVDPTTHQRVVAAVHAASQG